MFPHNHLNLLLAPGTKYKVICPCTTVYVKEAHHIARKVFGKRGSLPISQIQEWVQKNPYVLSVMVDHNYEPRGYFDLLPLHEGTYRALENGIITERDLHEDTIVSPFIKHTYLYLAGIATTDRNPVIGYLLFVSLLLKLRHFYRAPLTVGAVGASSVGVAYLEHFGFVQGPVAAGGRQDQMPFYQRHLKVEDLDFLLDDIGRRTQYLDANAYSWRFKS
jgi:hypothetical protein